MSESRPVDVGEAALRRALLTRDQLDDCRRELAERRGRGEEAVLEQILLRRKIVDARTLSELLRPRAGPTRVGKYELKGQIGEGAMGRVFHAVDPDLGRAVAVKILKDPVGPGEETRRRFRREGRAAARLSHPNVVAVHDTGEEEGLLYLVMELVEGRPLDRLLPEGRSNLRAVAHLMAKVARGVSAAHAEGVIHRDLKPANILVTARGEPKVTDFGLARLMDAGSLLTRPGAVLGTPYYMAPEILAEEPDAVGPWTDVYSLGAILYEAATGRRPHEADSLPAMYRKILHEEPAPPRRLDPSIPELLEKIILKALSRDRRSRHPTAGALAADLEEFVRQG